MPKPACIHIGNQSAFSALTPLAPFDYALENGFDAFEWFPDKKPWGAGWDEADLTPELRRAIRDKAKVRRVRLSVHSRWQANPLKPEARSMLTGDVELAEDLGAAVLNIHLWAEEGLAAHVNSIAWLLDRVAGTGMQLAIENTPLTTAEQFNELFGRLRELKSVPTNHAGMCLDLGHANLCATTRNDYLKYLGHLDRQVPIIHLHLHENWGDFDSHLTLFTGPAQRDDSGVRTLLRCLRRRNYSGSMILEQWPHPPALLNLACAKLLTLLDEFPAAEKAPVPRRQPVAGTKKLASNR
ncbi:MAG: sugar phosphate isomerase/epimerase [Verrucomicrobiota bacterium]|nr:sugar phosphate isomerase/epimerase [Verrucomicrobiota bacterium]